MNKKISIMLWTAVLWASSIMSPMLSNANNFANNINGGVNLNLSRTDESAWDAFIDFVQNAVNWILWVLWLIAVIILIWWGFQMVTAAGDDGKYKKWFTIVKQATIGLILIWVSWLIISLIFSFVWSTADNATSTWTTNTTQQ